LTKQFWPQFLKTFVFFLVVSSLILFPSLWYLDAKQKEVLITRATQNLVTAEKIVSQIFRERTGDIQLLSSLPVIQSFLQSPSDEVSKHLTDYFELTCQAYKVYDQVRLLDINGQELIRINKDKDRCSATPSDGLQNKSDRYYFQSGIALNSGEVYISPMDLNIENGLIEIPPKPTIRFSAPIISEQGQVLGLVVLNYLAKDLIDQLFDVDIESTIYGPWSEFDLLNQDGYYLKSSLNPAKEFGFMTGQQQHRFDKHYPSVWRAITLGDPVVEYQDGIFISQKISLPVNSHYIKPDVLQKSEKIWLAIIYLSKESLNSSSIFYNHYTWFAYISYVIAVILLSYLWTDRIFRNESIIALKDSLSDSLQVVRDSNLILEKTQSLAQIASWSINLGVDEIITSKEFRKMYGVVREPYRFQDLLETIHPDDRASTHQILSTVFESPYAGETEYRVVVNDKVSWLHVHWDLERNKAGEVIAFRGYSQDITEQQKLRHEIQEDREKYQLILNLSSDAIFLLDPDSGQIVEHSRKTATMLGYDVSELKHLNVLDWDKDFASIEEYRDLTQLIGSDDIYVEREHTRKDGSTYIAGVTAVRVSIQDHDYISCIVRDITLQKQYDKDLQQARDLAEQSNQAKTIFLANMSHEIRTPLSAAIGQLQLLAQSGLNLQQMEQLKSVQASNEILLSLINNILDMGKIEAGKLVLESYPVSIRQLQYQLDSMLRPNAIAKGIALELQVESAVPEWVMLDGTRMLQVLLNLLNNAIKFTDHGIVRLKTSISSDELSANEDLLSIDFEVTDTGIGIAPERQMAIFERFEQADKGTTRRFGGTGLGLAICSSLVDAMGGELALDSTPGEGSRFYFSLQCAVAPKATVELAQAHVTHDLNDPDLLAGLHILLAEDNPNLQKVMIDLLSRLGAKLTLATDGKQVLERVKALENLDLVLMDIQMPVMDGQQAAQEIRKMYASEQLPIFAMTASAMKEDRERAFANGMNAYLIKPVNIDNLIKEIANCKLIESSVPSDPEHTAEGSLTKLDEHAATAEILDLDSALKNLAGNRDTYKFLAEGLLSDMPGYRDKLSLAISQADTQAVEKILHNFKGVVSQLGAQALTGWLADVIIQLRKGIAADQLKEIDEKFLQMSETFVKQLKLNLTRFNP